MRLIVLNTFIYRSRKDIIYLKGRGKMLLKTQTIATSAFLYEENKFLYSFLLLTE